MDKRSLAQRRQVAFAAMIPGMVVSRTGNPRPLGYARGRRYVGHPSGWRFVLEDGGLGPLVLAAPPKHRLSAALFLVEGLAEVHVKALLGVV
jgi:hypothetical protein